MSTFDIPKSKGLTVVDQIKNNLAAMRQIKTCFLTNSDNCFGSLEQKKKDYIIRLSKVISRKKLVGIKQKIKDLPAGDATRDGEALEALKMELLKALPKKKK